MSNNKFKTVPVYNNIHFLPFPGKVSQLVENNNSLKQALNRLEGGTQDTIRSWFYEHKDPDWILSQVRTELIGMKDLKVIADWDLAKSAKYAPQGGSAPLKDRLNGLEEYFLHLQRPSIIDDVSWKQAKKTCIRQLRQRFGRWGFTPLTPEQVVDQALGSDKYSTNSGYPLFMKRKKEEAIEQALATASISIDEEFPFVLGTRATMGKTGVDARNIFMAPMAVNVYGQRFALVIQDLLRKMSTDIFEYQQRFTLAEFFLPWEGWETVQKCISQRWGLGIKFGADYTKMDQHFNVWHALECFDVISTLIKREYWDEMKESITYTFTAPVITNLGYIRQLHALLSGSEWTNLLETVWNWIFVHYLEIKYHLQFEMAQGIGDDQLWIIGNIKPGKKSEDWLTETVIKEFEYAGLPGNSDKQEVSWTETGFLQRLMTSEWYGFSGKMPAAGVYSLIRNVTSQVYPEKYHNDKNWDSDMFALRVIMIAENCVQHPLFRWYVEFCAKSNDNVLDFIRKGQTHALEVQEKAREIGGFLPTYNQEKQNKSITDFETYKLMVEMI